MPDTVPVTLDLPREVAEALQDPATRERAAQAIHDAVRPALVERLLAVMDEIGAEARRRGLTDEILEEELAAYNAERREGEPPPPAA
jgi:hypothetical protein